VLPDPQDYPAALPERAIHNSVASSVAGKFLLPESTVGSWLRCVSGATVPEATVDENGKAEFRKCKIRIPENRAMATPTGEAMSSEEFY